MENKMFKRKANLLVVDDNPTNLQLVNSILKKDVYKVKLVSSGKLALNEINNEPPDLILLDINMPEMDGFETCKHIKENPETREIPVIFLTARTEIEDIIQGFKKGAVDYVVKPFNPMELLARVNTHLQLKFAREENEELMRHRTALTHMIIHDINNLLTTTLGISELLLNDTTMCEDSRRRTGMVLKSAENIHAMTESILEVEKLESGTLAIAIEDIDVWEIMKERVQIYKLQADEKNINLILKDTLNNNIIKADPFLISRVIDNLIFNAVKFCPKNGTIQIASSKDDNQYIVEIVNDGEPIPKEFHNRIFEKFSQVDVREGIGRKGVGLGLTFCKMAIEKMNGNISVESPVPGRKDGVKFEFRLPLE